MIEGLISSKTRIRLLVKFFLNPAVTSYLREIAAEFGESTNGIRLELNRLSEAGVLESAPEGKTISLFLFGLFHFLLLLCVRENHGGNICQN